MPTPTCQVCGRPIKLVRGRIAHHGYRHPHAGYQTASCYGARYLPYEQANNALHRALAGTNEALDKVEATLERLRNDPPAELTEQVLRSGRGVRETKMYTRPDGFNPKMMPCTTRPHTYESVFWHRVSSLRQRKVHLEEELVYLGDRLAAWKAPTTN